MPNKSILFKEDGRSALMKGIRIMVEAVAVTLGPKGRNVVLDKQTGTPHIINDGISIAREINLTSNIENTGVKLIRQATSKTNDVAGDGTTTATILAHAIVSEGLKSILIGNNPIRLKSGLEKSSKFLVSQIIEYSLPIENLENITNVAIISSGNDVPAGSMICEAIKSVGKDGLVSLEESKKDETELEVAEGLRFNSGFFSPYFVTNIDKMEISLEEPYLLLVNSKIKLLSQDFLGLLESIARSNKSLLIIASEFEDEVIQTLILNKLKNILNVVAVKAPHFGGNKDAFFTDIGVLTNTCPIESINSLQFKDFALSDLGVAQKVHITKTTTTIINNKTSLDVATHCESLKLQITKCQHSYEKELLQSRIAKLLGGVAIIKVGAPTETELQDKKLRLEDAINATQAAIEEGIVPGGGVLFLTLAKNLRAWAKLNLSDDELAGALIVSKSLAIPFKRIIENAGQNSSLILERILLKDFPHGYNAENLSYGNMYELGVVDPSKVSRSVIQNAISIASMILTTECVVVIDQ